MKTNLLDYFEQTVAARPDRSAVLDGDRVMTFEALAYRAQSLGTYLADRDPTAMNRPISVFLEKSIESVYADIGILYSGNAYMNLDVSAPRQRLINIIAQIQPACILTDAKHAGKLAGVIDPGQIIVLEAAPLPEPDTNALSFRRSRLIDTDPLCIINTSGSTGTPKGVVLNHRSFIDFTEWANEITGIGENEIIGSLSPIVFDIYSFELCMLMANGSTLLVLPEQYAAFPAMLLGLMQEHRVTYIFWVPTIMVNIANKSLLSKIQLPELKMIWFAGEVFPTKQFNVWRNALPDAVFINLYGPIEITLDCTYYIVDRDIPDGEPIPIGYPCRNTAILLLSEDNKLCQPGEEGELCVRGTSLAMGYYNDAAHTAAAFVQNPLNTAYPEIIYRTGDIAAINGRGELIFKGRKDTLIKHSGYRIELGEIEHAAINTLGLVENGCAVYDDAMKEIVLYYEAAEDLATAELRRQLGSILPKYMIPARFIRLDSMPRNPNGKIDRLKLRARVNG